MIEIIRIIFLSVPQIRARIAGTMKTIVTMVMRDTNEAERLVSIRHDLNNYECYYPLVDLFTQKCYQVNQVKSF